MLNCGLTIYPAFIDGTRLPAERCMVTGCYNEMSQLATVPGA
jgi:hypothetical protein